MLLLLAACASKPRCPADMRAVPGDKPGWCIDTYEDHISGREKWSGPPTLDGSDKAENAAGLQPSELVTWPEARDLCLRKGRHLCTVAEWRDACDGVPGPGGRKYAWGDAPRAKQCPLILPMLRPETHSYPSGAWKDCHTPDGVYDLLGNLWEWVDSGLTDSSGNPRPGKIGASFYSGQDRTECDSPVDVSHPLNWAGSIGFRCCDELDPE